ncbi:MAG: hypothetical protein AAF694_06300 [Bacteroidota bacterium]
MKINKFITLTLGIFFLLVAIAYILSEWGGLTFSLEAVVISLIVVWTLTVIAFALVDRDLTKTKPTTLLNRILGSMLIKMVVGLASIAIVGIFFKPFLKEYVVGFIVAYFILTGFEVNSLIGKLRAVSKESSE